MFSAIFSIFLAVGFISVVSGLDEEQRSAYEAAFKCTKAGWYGDGHSLRAEGKEATNAEMLEACCTFSRAFVRCISKLDPAVFATPAPNIAHVVVVLEWQHMVFAEKAGLCTDMQYGELSKIAKDSGILKKENLVNIEKVKYEQCAGDAMRKCIIDAEIRMKQMVDRNFFTWAEHYFSCFKDPGHTCNAQILQDYTGYIHLYEKYFLVDHAKFGKMARKMPLPTA